MNATAGIALKPQMGMDCQRFFRGKTELLHPFELRGDVQIQQLKSYYLALNSPMELGELGIRARAIEPKPCLLRHALRVRVHELHAPENQSRRLRAEIAKQLGNQAMTNSIS